MNRHFERELSNLQERLLTLFGTVEGMIFDASRALCQRDYSGLMELDQRDRHVNSEEVRIEEECLKILALHQPVAKNLRQITAVFKINLDLERIADLASNIAERAACLQETPWFPIPEQIAELARRSTEMVHTALDAFVNGDLELAKEVIYDDAAVDELNRVVIAELKGLMAEGSELIEPALHCFSASRHFERIADHAENIAEDVIYLISGEIIRHQHGEFLLRVKNDASN